MNLLAGPRRLLAVLSCLLLTSRGELTLKTTLEQPVCQWVCHIHASLPPHPLRAVNGGTGDINTSGKLSVLQLPYDVMRHHYVCVLLSFQYLLAVLVSQLVLTPGRTQLN